MSNHVTFWERCAEHGVVVVPVKVYSQYGEDGNEHEEHFVAVRFAALSGPSVDTVAVGPEYWFMVEDSSAGVDRLHATPEAALEAALMEREKEDA